MRTYALAFLLALASASPAGAQDSTKVVPRPRIAAPT
jgi:hypothetical protein